MRIGIGVNDVNSGIKTKIDFYWNHKGVVVCIILVNKIGCVAYAVPIIVCAVVVLLALKIGSALWAAHILIRRQGK